MQTMERLGGYISRGVYTVSGSFHPFGGAVDIIVVEQPDGSFKSSPWYVRFGKFQGVLKAKEKVVQISVNGVDADFHMYLDHRGEACFLREVDAEDGESITSSSSSSSDETDDVNKGPLKSISCNLSSDKSNSAAQVDIISKGNKPLARTNSRRSRILRFVLGRKSMKGDNNDTNNDIHGKVDDPGIERRDSLERAEIAASLLDIKWSTSLAGTKPNRKNSVKTQESSSLENGLDQHKLNEEEGISSKSTIIDVAEDIEGKTNLKDVVYVSGSTGSDLQFACVELETHIEKQVSGEEVSSVSPDDVPVYCKTSESSAEAVDYSGEETHAVLYLAGGGCQEVHVHAEILHATTVLLPEVVKTEEVTKNTDQGMPVKDVSEFLVSDSNYGMEDGTEPPTLQDPQIVNLDQGLCSFNTTSSYGSLDNRVLEENSKDNDVSSILSLPPGSVGHCFLDEAMSKPPSANLEEEHFLFRDLGECKSTYQCEESVSCGYVDKEDHPSSVDSIEKVDADYNSHSSPESSITENKKVDIKRLIPTRSPINIPRSKVAKGEVEMQIRSLPNISSHNNGLDKDEVRYPLSQSLVSKSKSLNYTLPGKDCLKSLQSDGDKENQLLHEDPDDKHNHSSGEFKSTALNPHIGDPSRLNPSGGNWGVWPFSFRRSRSAMATQTALIDAKITTSGDASESTMSTDADNNELKPNPTRKKVRVKTPTSEQLASLNLKEGRNTVTFTFATAMLGKQQVDAHIYLWKWNTRIVISDVDGTITRSDVLGQFMPLVGVDWSQTGVTHLFSAIRENGYHMLFLSARSISQAYHTRQFLFNLKQNGKVLPDGPVLISPDGLFPSLYREVIRRAPHEFKIACLEDIRALFPSDYNPFYAGFGNRDTDEISYFKVGIPKGKVFIINPKGEVAVNRRLDTKSYTSLHALVHGMFPPMKSSEQEDFNTWNFWKLPPPAIDI